MKRLNTNNRIIDPTTKQPLSNSTSTAVAIFSSEYLEKRLQIYVHRPPTLFIGEQDAEMFMRSNSVWYFSHFKKIHFIPALLQFHCVCCA